MSSDSPELQQGSTKIGRRLAKSALRIVGILGVLYLFVLAGMMYFEESFVFVPTNFAGDDWHPSDLNIIEAHFESGDGTKLHGWYVEREHPRAVVLFCHGNAGNITHRADVLRDLTRRTGVSVMVFDYRGYGRSEGKPTETGVLADARAARAWLAKQAKIPENRIVLMGESIGGGVAIDLATDGARALILENTFTSIPDVAAIHFPWLPVHMVMRTRFDSLAKIGKYHGPIFQTHGDRDTIVPIRFGRQLFEAANEPKQFHVIPGYDHNDGRPKEYYEQLATFLDGVK